MKAPGHLKPEAGRPLEKRPFDAVSVLTVWLGLVFFIPASQVVEQVGAAGKPAILFSYGMLIMWLGTRFVPGAVLVGRQPMRWLLGIYLVTFIISYSLGTLRGLAELETNAIDRSLISQVAMVSVAVVAIDGIPSRDRFDDLMLRLVAFAALSSIVGVLQFFLTYDLTEVINFPGLGLNGNEPTVTIDNRNGFNRVAATGGHAIEFGAVMAMMLPISLHYMLHDRPGPRRSWLLVATVLIGLGIPISISRTSVVAVTIVAVGLAMGWSGRLLVRAIMATLVAGALLRAAVPSLIGSTLNLFTGLGDDSSFTARASDYPIVFRFIGERPLFGRGPGTFGPTGYILLDNEILSTTVNSGIVGLVSFLSLYLLSMGMFRRTVWKAASDETRHLAMSMVTSLMVAIVVLYFADMKFFAIYLSLSFLLFGLSGSLWRLRDEKSRFDVKPRWYLKPKLRADRVNREHPLPFDRIVNRGVDT